MRKLIVIASTFFLFAGLAAAQVPTSGNIFFGYSFYSTDLSSIDRANTNGWQASLEGKVFSFLGIVADFDGHYGSQNFPTTVCPGQLPCLPAPFSANLSEHNVLFGPRFSASVGKFRPFAEFEIGVGHVSESQTDTSLATAVGGGVDYKILHALAWRVQGDYVHTHYFSAGQNNVRISTGIVLRF